MKKKTLIILTLLLFIVPMTGCVKYNATMDIKVDKSMDFSIIYALDTSVFDDEEVLKEDELKNVEDNGFKVTEYTDGTLKGFTLFKNFSNIDEISSTDKVEYSLGNIFEDSTEKTKMFKIEKGFLKNKYTAILKFDSEDSSLNSPNPEEDESYDEEDSSDEDLVFEEDYNENENLEDEADEEDEESNMDFSSMMDFDLSFTVKLPNESLSNNASKVSDDGKTLEWELTTDEASSIEFSFELENKSAKLILIGGGVVLLIVIISVVLIVLKKSKKNKNGKTQVEQEQNVAQPISVEPVVIAEPTQSVEPVQVQPVTPVENVTQPISVEPVQTQQENINNQSEL